MDNIFYNYLNEHLKEFTQKDFKTVIDFFSLSMNDYLYFYNITQDYYYISKRATKRFNIENNEFYDAKNEHKKFVYEDDYDILVNEINQLDGINKKKHNIAYRWISKTGDIIWINCRGYVFINEETQDKCLIGCINEVGQTQYADNATGLIGEIGFKSYFDEEIKNKTGYIMKVGVDHFKVINERHGILFGNEILKNTAVCIEDVLDENQKVFKSSLDNFLIVDKSNDYKKAIETYEHIKQNIQKYILNSEYKVIYTISAGIFIYDDNYEYLDVMKWVDYALEHSKNDGRNRTYLFNKEDYNHFLREQNIISAMRLDIIDNFKDFDLYFQPIINASKSNLIGAEALIRYKNDEYGNIGPAEFIPYLEQCNLIIPVGLYVLETACEFASNIQKFIPNFKIHVNVSYKQVMSSNMIDDVIRIVTKYGLNKETLVIELTESGFLENNKTLLDFCNILRENNVRIALDDFGTGYSNFHYLNELQPDSIKINRDFTINALYNDYDRYLVQYMIKMAHKLDILVCVEGIESLDELININELKPDYIQGYYFGKPMKQLEFVDKFISKEKII